MNRRRFLQTAAAVSSSIGCVNGRSANLSGKHGDTVIIQTRNEKSFEVIGQLG